MFPIYFHLLHLAFRSQYPHWSDEVHRMNSAFQNFHSQGSFYYLPFHEPHILNDFVHQSHGLSQGVWDSLSYCTFIRRVCCIVCSQRQGMLASSVDAQSQSQHPPQSRWSINICWRTETACQSQLCPAFDVCSEDTQLINGIQRLDISVSLRGFVTGQCSVMNILKIDLTECRKPPTYPYPIPDFLAASDRCWRGILAPQVYNFYVASVINRWQLASLLTTQ